MDEYYKKWERLIEGLTPEQINAAYRVQELRYRITDVSRIADQMGLNCSYEDARTIAIAFLMGYDANLDENSQLEHHIEEYFKD